jgi:peptidoglycan/xylan/chitin deacetylase (PgdA/CDA1 family)
MTFDDGPYNFTDHVLDLLDSYKAKATFFITGNNLGKGEIDNPSYVWSDIIKRMYNSGHQVASHTWSHQDLSTLNTEQMKSQIYYNEMAFRNILGFFPQYMRPPYSSCNTNCQKFLADTGYHVIYFDLDTEDYLHDDPIQIQISKNDVLGNLSTRADPNGIGFLVIGHDIHEQTAFNLTEFALQQFQAKGFRMVTVGECLGDPSLNWYRDATGYQTVSPTPSAAPPPPQSPPSPPPSEPSPSPSPPAVQPTPVVSLPISSSGQCGASVGLTCRGSSYGDCCSPAGWW